MSLLIKLKENKNFSKSEKKVAKYIIDNFKYIKNTNISKIKNATSTSNSCITRTCKKIGLSGFLELKLKILQELSNFNNLENIDYSNIDNIINSINNISIATILENKELQEYSIIEKIVKLIEKKNIIDFYGIGASHLVCLDAEYKFMRIGKITHTFSEPDKKYIQAINSNEDHLAIIVSYSGITKEIIEIANILNKKGVSTVSITKYSDNDLSNICDYNLYVSSKESTTYSIIAMLNIIDILYFSYSNRNFDKVSNYIKNTIIKK